MRRPGWRRGHKPTVGAASRGPEVRIFDTAYGQAGVRAARAALVHKILYTYAG